MHCRLISCCILFLRVLANCESTCRTFLFADKPWATFSFSKISDADLIIKLRRLRENESGPTSPVCSKSARGSISLLACLAPKIARLATVEHSRQGCNQNRVHLRLHFLYLLLKHEFRVS